MATNFRLPGKIKSFLLKVAIGKSGAIREAIESSAFTVHAGLHSDFDSVGHVVNLYLPFPLLESIGDLDEQENLAEDIKAGLNACARAIPNEYIFAVILEAFDDDNPDCVAAQRIIKGKRPIPESTVWKPGYVRLFISHRDTHKVHAAQFAKELERYGVSSFVSHDCIEALTDWPDEIRSALFSMDALLVFLTDDFQASWWTDQEVGVAIGRQVPVIPLKLQSKNPYGMLMSIQAMKGNLAEIQKIAGPVFERLATDFSDFDRLRKGAIEAFANSTSFNDSIFAMSNLLPRVSKLDPADVQRIVSAFAENSQLHGCIVVRRDLPAYMKRLTNTKYTVQGDRLVKVPFA